MPHGVLLTNLLKNVGQVINSVYSHPLDQIADPALQNTEEENEENKKKKFLDKIIPLEEDKKIKLGESEATSILKKVTNTPSHKLRNVMFKKMLLKYINIFYDELIKSETPCEYLCDFVYSILIKKYSMKKAADSKFSHLLASCVKYKSITRIRVFARFIGLYEAFDNEDLKFYMNCYNFLMTSPSGTVNSQDCLEFISIPYVRCVECIKFYEKLLPKNGVTNLKVKLDKMRKVDRVNRLGVVDIDEFLEQIVETFNDFNKSTKNFMKSIYEAADLNDDGYLQFKEFELILRFLTDIPFSHSITIELFSEYAETFLSEEEEEVKAISFENLCHLNKYHKIFKASSIRNLLGFSNQEEADRTLDIIQGSIEDVLSEFLWRFSETQAWDENLDELKVLLGSVQLKILSKKDPDTALLAYKLIDLESKRMIVDEKLYELLPKFVLGFS